MTWKLTTCFVDGLTSREKSQSIASSLIGSAHIYIGYLDLEGECTQYGIFSQVAFQYARTMFL